MRTADSSTDDDRSDTAADVHRLLEVGADDISGLQKVAELHMELLDYGPIAGLGERFIRDIGYRMHIQDGVLRVLLYEVNGDPAGFVSYTADSFGFHRHSLASHLLRVSWSVFISIVSDLSRIPKLLRAIRVLLSRRDDLSGGEEALGEVVSIAVRPHYLRHAQAPSGRRISEELVALAAGVLQQAGLTQMRMLVDADNKAVLFLYHRLGANFSDYRQAGEEMVQVMLELDECFGGDTTSN